MKLLAAAGDSRLEHNDSMDGGLKEDSDASGAPQSRANDTLEATASQESVTVINSQYAPLVGSALMISESDDPGRPQQVAEAADEMQEWSFVITLARK